MTALTKRQSKEKVPRSCAARKNRTGTCTASSATFHQPNDYFPSIVTSQTGYQTCILRIPLFQFNILYELTLTTSTFIVQFVELTNEEDLEANETILHEFCTLVPLSMKMIIP